MKDTSSVGTLSEMKVSLALMVKGFWVFTSINPASRCDILYMDEEEKIFKVQCKTGRIRKGSVIFSVYSMTASGAKSYTKEEVDIFGVYCPDNDKTYLIPIEACSKGKTRLRLEPTKNGQVQNNKFAKDFEI